MLRFTHILARLRISLHPFMGVVLRTMNPLANSQINEIEKFISQSGLPTEFRPVVRRHTGQESHEDGSGSQTTRRMFSLQTS